MNEQQRNLLMAATTSGNDPFLRVIGWLIEEREYQTKKFDYDEQRARVTDYDYWIQQFDSYIQRLPIFGLEIPQGKQAALKLAATAVALCEFLDAPLPRPGVPSGEIR